MFINNSKKLITMKSIILTTVLILLGSMLTMGSKIVAKGSSNSPFGDYKIEILEDHMLLNGKELDKYMITYAKSELKVMVVLDKQQKCKKYYVLTDKAPVQYECNGVSFGIKKLDNDLMANGFATCLDNLNKEGYYHQKVIANGAITTLDHLELIACYYPELVKGTAS
jgi:hypothetical protein